jgi:tetratricopeptide (TPR) repeat protein
MTVTSPTLLDAEEMFHLAMAASQANDAAAAIDYLKRATTADPAMAKAHYMLGAEHAQLGMFDRAINDMDTAIQCDPDLHAARFQLGLLLITSRRVDEAETAWQTLSVLGTAHYFVLFRDGLLHLARDEFSDAAKSLKAGIDVNTENMPLNTDMKKVLDGVERLMANAIPASEEPDVKSDSSSNHLLVNAYSGYRKH